MSDPMEVTNIPFSEIWVDADFNCRGAIKHIDVVDLVKDIEKNGLIQPVTVAPLTPEQEEECFQKTGKRKKYRLIAGYRRSACYRVLNRTSIEAIIRVDMQDEEKARCFNFSENLHRKDLDLIQETKAVEKLREVNPYITEKEMAEKLGVSRGWVQIRTMMADLPDDIQQEVVAFKITNKQIRNLFSIYGVSGLDEGTKYKMTVDALKVMKDGKLKGRSVQVNANLKDKTKKRMRTRSDMVQLLDHLGKCGIPFGPHTRVLAWAAGNISDVDLHKSLRTHALEEGRTYLLPHDITLTDLGD
jgi:ParB/RepB/Spo0J family partition protein